MRSRSLIPALCLSTALLAAAGVITGCRQGPTREELMKMAEQATAQGNTSTAIVHLKSVLQQREDAQVRLLLAQAYFDASDFAAAEKEARRLRELDPKHPEAEALVVRAMFEQQAFRRVTDETQAAAKAGTASPVILSYRAMALLAQSQIEPAEEALKAALSAAPGLSVARMGQARLAFVRGQSGEALRIADEVIAARPQDLDALLMKAELVSLTGKREEAIAAYRAVLAAQSKNLPAHIRLATLLAEAKRFDEAEKQLESLRRVAPGNAVADYLAAAIAHQKGDAATARARIAAVNRELPRFVPGWVLAGVIELKAGAPAAAESPLATAVKLAPDHLAARMLLAQALLGDRRPQQAYEALRPGLEIAPNAPTLLALAGEALFQSNEPKRAAEFLERAARLAPQDARVAQALALSVWAGGNAEQGLATLAANPAQDESTRRTGELLRVMRAVEVGRLEEAERLAAQLAQALPKDAIAHNLHGGVLARRGKDAEARKAFEAALESDPVHYSALVNLGLLDLRQGHRDAALARFDAVLAKHPDHLSGLLGKAIIGLQSGMPREQVIEGIERARRLYPRTLQPALMAARLHGEAGQFATALEAAKQAQSIAPRDPEVLQLLGTAQLQARDPAGAGATFTRWVALEPQAALPLLHLAQAQIAEGRSAAALPTVAKAVAQAPRAVPIHAEAVRLYLAAGRPEEAARQLAALKGLNPPPALADELEGDLRLAERSLPKALEAYRRAHATAPTTRNLAKLVAALSANGQAEQAIAAGRQWLKQHPDDVAARYAVADAATQARQMQAAAEQYEQIAVRRRDDVAVLNNLAAAYAAYDVPRALETARRAQRLDPENPYVLDTYGWVLVKSGQIPEGLRAIENAARNAPDNIEIAYHYAAALAKSGDRPAARLRLEQLLARKVRFGEEDEARALLKELGGTAPS
jgi:putative PEP-CTERM system TPR-repeat lipoprotein